MFRAVPLAIIRSSSLYTQQRCMSHRFADSLRAGSGRICSSVLNLLASCQQKHVEFYSKNKFEKLVHLVDLLQEFITMHGHLNVKKSTYVT